MSDIKLFRIKGSTPAELPGKSVALEKSLQKLIEKHLDTFLAVRFLDTEYSTGKVHGGRIDTLGIDENGCPVIIEYKRALNENVINQGLFYLDWLMDHRGEFELLVFKKLGKAVSEDIEWSNPRLICIAGDFTRYDAHAVQQIDRNIQLVRYRTYGDELLAFELVNTVSAERTEKKSAVPAAPTGTGPVVKVAKSTPGKLTLAEQLAAAGTELLDVYEALKAFALGMGDDVEVSHLKRYAAFRRIKNFACVVPLAHTEQLVVYVKSGSGPAKLEEGFTRDVSTIGHWGTGDLEITIRSMDDLEKAKPLIVRSYEAS